MVKTDILLPYHLYEGGVVLGPREKNSNNVLPTMKLCQYGHAYGEDGKCTRCGETNPSWVLEKKYSAAQEQLERNKQSAQQRASVSLAKLQKYLPHMIKQQGLQGLGVSQTAALRANNSYNTQMGTIDRDYNTAASDLFANYADGKVALESAAASDRLAREQLDLQKYQIETQTKQTEEANAEAKALSVYNDIIGMIDNGYYKSSSELRADIDANREVLGDYADRLDIIAGTSGEYIDEVAKDEAMTEEAETVKETNATFNRNGWLFSSTNFKAGDNFSVKVGETEYRVESGGEVTDEVIKQKAMSVKNNGVFIYGGDLYLKKDNAIYKIQPRESSYGPNSEKGYSELYKELTK